ncbi:MAG: hypothetical protein U9R19_01965, partial [Bacteroidota bacterium]|nr:hypothetical protein [Bacteroidota bacterium]
MKKLILFCTFLLSFGILYSQSPQAFKYQAVARDGNGELIINQSVKIKIKILQNSTSGTVIYSETHDKQTNTFGLIDLEIGNGTIESGIFSTIDWSISAYFLRIEMDETGGTNFSHMGTSQLLSVPYALYAETSGSTAQGQGILSYTQSEIDNLSPNSGDMVYNLTTNCMNFFNGSIWAELCGDEDCVPLPSTANAGDNQFVYGNSTLLNGNIPQEGLGIWTVFSGSGNFVINEPGNASSIFSGDINEIYTLVWTISTFCGSNTDTVEIQFTNCDDGILCTNDYFANGVCHHDPIVPTIADAGPDQTVFGDSTILGGNLALVGTGSWSVTSGTGWSISDFNDPTTLFSGNNNTDYVLAWEISDPCGTTSDNVTISFFNCDDGDACTYDYYDQQTDSCYHDTIFPTTANAGDDQKIYGNSTTLAANEAIVGTGGWWAISGANPSFGNANFNETTFSGDDNTVYELVWKIDNSCSISSDTVVIEFFNCDDGDACTEDIYDQQNDSCYHYPIIPTIANAGQDQTNASSPTNLQANTALVGTGSWTISSGTGGNITDPLNPQSEFTGSVGNNYILVWTIEHNCDTTSDIVEITFGNSFICGSDDLIDTRDSQTYGTVEINGRCWMTENLNYGTYGIAANGQSDNSIA